MWKKMDESESTTKLKEEVGQIFDSILAIERYVSMRQRAHEGDYVPKLSGPKFKKENMLLYKIAKGEVNFKTLLDVEFPENSSWNADDTPSVMLSKLP